MMGKAREEDVEHCENTENDASCANLSLIAEIPPRRRS